MKFTKTDSTDTINGLKYQLYHELTAPIDAMWEILYIGSSQTLVDKNKERLERNENYYKRRQAIVEHPYGTIK